MNILPLTLSLLTLLILSILHYVTGQNVTQTIAYLHCAGNNDMCIVQTDGNCTASMYNDWLQQASQASNGKDTAAGLIQFQYYTKRRQPSYPSDYVCCDVVASPCSQVLPSNTQPDFTSTTANGLYDRGSFCADVMSTVLYDAQHEQVAACNTNGGTTEICLLRAAAWEWLILAANVSVINKWTNLTTSWPDYTAVAAGRALGIGPTNIDFANYSSRSTTDSVPLWPPSTCQPGCSATPRPANVTGSSTGVAPARISSSSTGIRGLTTSIPTTRAATTRPSITPPSSGSECASDCDCTGACPYCDNGTCKQATCSPLGVCTRGCSTSC